MINAQIVADSLSPQGDRLISVLATFPRIILAEVNTHRMLSKNTSSSRAIPFKKMVEAVQENPFIPIAWQKHHSGMQGTEYLIHTDANVEDWLKARDYAIEFAQNLNNGGEGVTKQLCNRLLEPFMWTTMLITGSKEGWDNFFELRCPQYYYEPEEIFFKSKKDWTNYYEDCFGTNVTLSNPAWRVINKGQAEIHIMDLAEKIYDAFNESTPRQLLAGEWHIPFEDKIISISEDDALNDFYSWKEIVNKKVKVSTAMAARTSYTVVGDEKEINYERMIELHDRLIEQNPPHSSPMEHCARTMSDEEYNLHVKGTLTYDLRTGMAEPVSYPASNIKGWCRNFRGFIQYRHIIETGGSI